MPVSYTHLEGEMVTMPNHPNKPEMGSRQVPFSGEIWIDRADFREEMCIRDSCWISVISVYPIACVARMISGRTEEESSVKFIN